jgi:DNA replication protein DnaC
MSWAQVVERFNIQSVFREANLDAVEFELNKPIADIFRDWVKAPYNKKSWLLLTGNTGSGKTYCAIAIVRALYEKNPLCWLILVRADDLDDELLEAIKAGQEKTVIKKYQEVDYLVIDDLGVERSNDRIIKQYYSIIDSRYGNKRPTIFTSNLTMPEIKDHFGERIESRMFGAIEIKFPNKDLRKSRELAYARS